MIHYHGTPITPKAKLVALAGHSFCVSFARPDDVELCHEIGESVMLDNGAFTIWQSGEGEVDVSAYATWASEWLSFRSTWCVIPDRITGDEEANDELLATWETLFSRRTLAYQCAPVWHMHESFERLERLARKYLKVCIGSSGEYSKVGTPEWHTRMAGAMDHLCGTGPAPCWLHMLRGLDLSGSRYPFASADSASLGRNHGGSKSRPGFDIQTMARRIDAHQCPALWELQ